MNPDYEKVSDRITGIVLRVIALALTLSLAVTYYCLRNRYALPTKEAFVVTPTTLAFSSAPDSVEISVSANGPWKFLSADDAMNVVAACQGARQLAPNGSHQDYQPLPSICYLRTKDGNGQTQLMSISNDLSIVIVFEISRDANMPNSVRGFFQIVDSRKAPLREVLRANGFIHGHSSSGS